MVPESLIEFIFGLNTFRDAVSQTYTMSASELSDHETSVDETELSSEEAEAARPRGTSSKPKAKPRSKSKAKSKSIVISTDTFPVVQHPCNILVLGDNECVRELLIANILHELFQAKSVESVIAYREGPAAPTFLHNMIPLKLVMDSTSLSPEQFARAVIHLRGSQAVSSSSDHQLVTSDTAKSEDGTGASGLMLTVIQDCCSAADLRRQHLASLYREKMRFGLINILALSDPKAVPDALRRRFDKVCIASSHDYRFLSSACDICQLTPKKQDMIDLLRSLKFTLIDRENMEAELPARQMKVHWVHFRPERTEENENFLCTDPPGLQGLDMPAVDERRFEADIDGFLRAWRESRSFVQRD